MVAGSFCCRFTSVGARSNQGNRRDQRNRPPMAGMVASQQGRTELPRYRARDRDAASRVPPKPPTGGRRPKGGACLPSTARPFAARVRGHGTAVRANAVPNDRGVGAEVAFGVQRFQSAMEDIRSAFERLRSGERELALWMPKPSVAPTSGLGRQGSPLTPAQVVDADGGLASTRSNVARCCSSPTWNTAQHEGRHLPFRERRGGYLGVASVPAKTDSPRRGALRRVDIGSVVSDADGVTIASRARTAYASGEGSGGRHDGAVVSSRSGGAAVVTRRARSDWVRRHQPDKERAGPSPSPQTKHRCGLRRCVRRGFARLTRRG